MQSVVETEYNILKRTEYTFKSLATKQRFLDASTNIKRRFDFKSDFVSFISIDWVFFSSVHLIIYF